jgi:hypothetical protein
MYIELRYSPSRDLGMFTTIVCTGQFTGALKEGGHAVTKLHKAQVYIFILSKTESCNQVLPCRYAES